MDSLTATTRLMKQTAVSCSVLMSVNAASKRFLVCSLDVTSALQI